MSRFENIISGRSRGVIPLVLRGMLRGFSWPWGLVMRLRNHLYAAGYLPIHRAPVPVISVGNLTTGGTGKTPVTAFLCQRLLQLGCHPGIISRGYRAHGPEGNDEKQVLRILVPDVAHEQHADRLVAARRLFPEGAAVPGPDVIVMDDGLQHRRLHRDLNLILVDATNPFGYGHVLPRGLLREPVSGLRRADLVLLTRCELVSEAELCALEREIELVVPQLRSRILRVSFAPGGLRAQSGQRTELAALQGLRVFLMSGIGNPAAFQRTCELAGLQIVGSCWFADHHQFSGDELQRVQQLAHAAGAAAVVVTLKDLVKIPADAGDFLALEIAAALPRSSDRELLDEHLRTLASGRVSE